MDTNGYSTIKKYFDALVNISDKLCPDAQKIPDFNTMFELDTDNNNIVIKQINRQMPIIDNNVNIDDILISTNSPPIKESIYKTTIINVKSNDNI